MGIYYTEKTTTYNCNSNTQQEATLSRQLASTQELKYSNEPTTDGLESGIITAKQGMCMEIICLSRILPRY